MSEKPKDCAHCGFIASIRTDDSDLYYVQCTNIGCGISTLFYTTLENALEVWNQRVKGLSTKVMKDIATIDKAIKEEEL